MSVAGILALGKFVLEKVLLTNQCIWQASLFSLSGQYIFSEWGLGIHRSLRASLIDGEWVRGREVLLMLCPQNWTPLLSLCKPMRNFFKVPVWYSYPICHDPSRSPASH